jgi:hypothetical protein
LTVGQLILSFKQKLDKTDSQAYPDFLDEEIRFWLDQAADRFAQQRYERNNIKRRGFEETQKRVDDLRATVRTEEIAAVASTDYPGFAFNVPLPIAGADRYRHLLKVQVEVRDVDCNDEQSDNWTTPYQVQQDDLHSLFNDPFNKPIPSSPLFTIEGDDIVFFTDRTFEVLRARISYMRMFDKLQPGLPTTSVPYQTDTTEYIELSADTHEEVVDIAVKMVLENIESQRYQTNTVEIREQE